MSHKLTGRAGLHLAALGCLLVMGTVLAQETVFMSPEEDAKFEARLRNWAMTYYPAMVTAPKLPDDIFFAFLVDDKDAVVRHTAAFKTPRDGTLLSDELARVFPETEASQLKNSGGGCFFPKPGQPRPYCVYFAVLPRGKAQGR